jgi:ERCC4-type nuclease
MNIVIDTRETKLLSYINNTNVTFTIKSEALDIGDIHLCCPDNTCIVIFERKTINDLAASIQDGRYKEQAIRLSNSNIPNHYIIYMIEGDIDQYNTNCYSKHKITSKTLRASIVSILYTKGFSVIFTKNTQDTANWIMQFAEKIYKNGVNGYYNDNEPTQTTYTEHIKMKKQSNITPENIDQIMLSQIPGISIVIAKALLNHFKGFKILLHTLEQDIDCLNNFSYITTQGKERKVPKNVISNVKLYLKI